jgi:hypothetical protein
MKRFEWFKGKRSFWFRAFGFGFRMLDHRDQRPLYSERNGHGCFIHIGNKCFKLLAPEKGGSV